jgi:hypothetical protein
MFWMFGSVRCQVTTFLEQHYPITKSGFRGIYPVIIYKFTVFLLIGLNNLSLKLFLSNQEYKIDLLQQQTPFLIKEEKMLEVVKNSEKFVQEVKKGANATGIFVKWINHSIFSKFV